MKYEEPKMEIIICEDAVVFTIGESSAGPEHEVPTELNLFDQ